jgi:outer membrane protein assembly factor BamB
MTGGLARMRAIGTVGLIVGIVLVVSGGLPVSAESTAAPGLTLSRSSGPPTTRISASGSAFGASEAIDLFFDGTPFGAVNADANGSFSGKTLRVPASAKPGTHTILAYGRTSTGQAEAPFEVRTDWPQYRGGPAHLGFNRYENVLSVSNVDRLRRIWSFDTGAEVLSSSTVVDGMVYSGSQSGELYALEASSGDELWSLPVGGWGSPAVEDGTAYVAQGDVFALDAATGDQLWSYGAPDEQFGSSPALLEGVLYVVSTDTDTPGGQVAAIDASTGSLLWSRAVRGETWGAPAVVDGAVVVGTGAGRVYSLDASTGTIQWQVRTPCARRCYIILAPAVANGVIYIAASDDRLYALEAATGDRIWNTEQIGPRATPAVVGRVVYVGTGYGNVDAYSAATGALLWRFHAGGGDVESGATVANGVVYIGSNGDRLYALDASTGEKLWSYRTGTGIQADPTVVNGVVYVGSKDGSIYAFGLPH